MTGITAFLYSNDYLGYNFGSGHPLRPKRYEDTFNLLKKLGVFDDKAKHFEPKHASEDILQLVHSKEHVEIVKKMCEKGTGLLDGGDTPARKGIYEASCSKVGGSVLGADLIMQGKVKHAFNVGGGLHHAKRDFSRGFCVFNDVAIAARYLQKKYGLKRIAIVDVDGHHGDGTQEIFYNESILTISLHRFGGFFYPGTGYFDEIGEGEGEGYSVNVPLPARTNDDTYLHAFNEIVPPLIKKYEPEILLNQFGVDTHYQDPLVGLSLTTKAYEKISSEMHNLAHEVCDGRYLIFGGGGYEPSNVARCWAIMFITVSGAMPKDKREYEKLLDRVDIPVDERLVEEVMGRVDEVKKIIFPYHGL